MLKRATGLLVLTGVTLIVTAGNAIAQTSSYPVTPSPTTSVEGTGGSNGGTAFTGGSGLLSFSTLMVVALLIVGVTALLVARRRAARLAG